MPEMILSKLMDLLILFDPENGLNYETYLICLVLSVKINKKIPLLTAP